MKNPIEDDDYEKLKKEAKESYEKIGKIWCPALDDHIVFKKPGFRHLIWKGAQFWAFTKEIDGKKIRVVMRQTNGKEKHFFSVFEEK